MRDRLAVFHDDGLLGHDPGGGFFEAEASPYLEVAEPHPDNGARLRCGSHGRVTGPRQGPPRGQGKGAR